MSGTREGGKKAYLKNVQLHGADFYARIGAIGGAKGTTGGFAANRELARIAGAKGGRISRRRKTIAPIVPLQPVQDVAQQSGQVQQADDQTQLAA